MYFSLCVIVCVVLLIMCVIMQEQIYERFPPQINITKLVIHGSQIIIPTERARVYADQLWPPLLITSRHTLFVCYLLLLKTYSSYAGYIFKARYAGDGCYMAWSAGRWICQIKQFVVCILSNAPAIIEEH